MHNCSLLSVQQQLAKLVETMSKLDSNKQKGVTQEMAANGSCVAGCIICTVATTVVALAALFLVNVIAFACQMLQHTKE